MKFTSLVVFALFFIGCSDTDKGRITSSGTIEGKDVNIGAEVAGRVQRVRVDEGSVVQRGDTLVVIDDTEYRIQLRQADANLSALESAYRLATEGSRKEDIIQAEAAFTSAGTDFQRMKGLLASHTITQKQYDDVYTRYVAAEQTYRKLKEGLRPAEIKSTRDHRDAAAAQVDLLRKKVSDCNILAPSSGTVTLRAVEPGEFVTMGMNVVRVTYFDKVTLMIYLNETNLGMVKLGGRADVAIDSAPGKTFAGRIVYISPSAEFTPKNVQTKEERTKLVFGVKIEIDNPDGLLKPGLPADATITSTDQTGA